MRVQVGEVPSIAKLKLCIYLILEASLFDPDLDPTVVQCQDQDILGPRPAQPVHDLGHLLPLDHGANSQPSFPRLELGHGGRPSSGGDGGGLVEVVLVDVVVDEDVTLGGEDTGESGLEQGDDVRQLGAEGWVGLGGGDEDGFRCHQGGDGVQPGGSHSVPGF